MKTTIETIEPHKFGKSTFKHIQRTSDSRVKVLLTIPEVAKEYGISEITIRRRLKEFNPKRVGNYWLIDSFDAMRFKKNKPGRPKRSST